MPTISLNSAQRLFRVAEVSSMFGGVSAKSVYRLLDRGLLKSSSAFRHKLISRESIEEFLNKTVNNGGVR